jgi:hypothetical protein
MKIANMRNVTSVKTSKFSAPKELPEGSEFFVPREVAMAVASHLYGEEALKHYDNDGIENKLHHAFLSGDIAYKVHIKRTPSFALV